MENSNPAPLVKRKLRLAPVTTGTHFIGFVYATYASLAEALGNPAENVDPGKVMYEWTLTLNGKKFHIYDYNEPRPPSKAIAYYWHVGGRNQDEMYELIKELHRLKVKCMPIHARLMNLHL